MYSSPEQGSSVTGLLSTLYFVGKWSQEVQLGIAQNLALLEGIQIRGVLLRLTTLIRKHWLTTLSAFVDRAVDRSSVPVCCDCVSEWGGAGRTSSALAGVMGHWGDAGDAGGLS